MKKLTFILLLLLVLFCAELFCSKYLGISIRPHGAPLNCKISSDINAVLNCINTQYMKYDTLTAGWNDDLSARYLNARMKRFYRNSNMEFSPFTSIKPCYGKNNCAVTLKDENYRIDTYRNLVAYVKLNPETSSYTYNRGDGKWSNLMLPKLWMFRRSYKFPYHDIVIGHRNGKDIFYILSMEAVPLAGSYDLLIGSITAFCSETDRPKGKNPLFYRVYRNQVYMTVQPLYQVGQLLSILLGIIFSSHQTVFKSQSPSGFLKVISAGFHQFVHGIFPGYWHKPFPLFLI